jgi:hypothetical protein
VLEGRGLQAADADVTSDESMGTKTQELLGQAYRIVIVSRLGKLIGSGTDGHGGGVSLKCGIRKVYFRRNQEESDVAEQDDKKARDQRIEW